MTATRREYRPGLGVRRGLCRVRRAPVRGVVVHTTGAGPALRASEQLDARGRFDAWRARHPDPDPRSSFSEALWAFTEATPDSGHYLVGQERGAVVQVVPEDLVARHVGSAKARGYARRAWCRPGLEWWRERWPRLSDPRGLMGGHLWDGWSCNENTVGIEVAPPVEDPSGPWSPECWLNLGDLVAELALAHGFPFSRDYIVTHSDAHPRARSARGKPWDPGPRQWSWTKLAATGAPF